MKEQKGYVYTFVGNEDDLAHVAHKHLGAKVWHWVANPAHLDIKPGYPDDWRDQGAMFNEKGELRWSKQDDAYHALLLTETPIEELTALEGEWIAEEQHLFLQNLREARVHPSFMTYPTGESKGHIVVCLYKRNEMPLFLSVRTFKEE